MRGNMISLLTLNSESLFDSEPGNYDASHTYIYEALRVERSQSRDA
jgi:hypothetical protein